MQVILDSSFARPGSAPIRGGKKGEFRDRTNKLQAVVNKFSGLSPIVLNSFCVHPTIQMISFNTQT